MAGVYVDYGVVCRRLSPPYFAVSRGKPHLLSLSGIFLADFLGICQIPLVVLHSPLMIQAVLTFSIMGAGSGLSWDNCRVGVLVMIEIVSGGPRKGCRTSNGTKLLTSTYSGDNGNGSRTMSYANLPV